MKYIAIIFSIIFSIVSLILGQFIYPLIASFFDTLPNMFSFISKFLIWITISILTLKLTKENRVRLGIIFPYTVSLIISIILGVIRFGGSHYENGYIVHHGDLRNNIGMEVISGSDWYSHYFKCIDKNGNNIIVECWREEDENYENDSYGENIYIIKIKVYDENYQFLWRSDKRVYGDYISRQNLSEYVNGWRGIIIDKRLGGWVL